MSKELEINLFNLVFYSETGQLSVITSSKKLLSEFVGVRLLPDTNNQNSLINNL